MTNAPLTASSSPSTIIVLDESLFSFGGCHGNRNLSLSCSSSSIPLALLIIGPIPVEYFCCVFNLDQIESREGLEMLYQHSKV